ncbi:MAG: hypothetical protein QNI99_04965 [Woeseiaceae bacterium]|nr:hypothetical protein [Woeseiaceae bacterium]
MTDAQQAEQYRIAETLIGEQNFIMGLAAAVVATLAGALGWGAISVATGSMIGFVAIGLGVLVGYGMQVFGRGLTAKYSAVAAILSVIGCLAGNFVAGVMFQMKATGLSPGDILTGLTIDDLIAFYADTLQPMDLVFWALALGAAWSFATRKLTPDEESAMRAWAERPDSSQGFIR